MYDNHDKDHDHDNHDTHNSHDNHDSRDEQDDRDAQDSHDHDNQDNAIFSSGHHQQRLDHCLDFRPRSQDARPPRQEHRVPVWKSS